MWWGMSVTSLIQEAQTGGAQVQGCSGRLQSMSQSGQCGDTLLKNIVVCVHMYVHACVCVCMCVWYVCVRICVHECGVYISVTLVSIAVITPMETGPSMR